MAPPLRVVVSGLGRHAGKTVIPAIAAAEGWALAGVVSSRAAAATAAAAEHGVGSYTDLAAAIEAERPDAVYIAAVPADHRRACRTAMSAGVPIVICEKPLGTGAAEVTQLVDEARRGPHLLCEVMAYQHHPQFLALERLIGDEAFGELVHGFARFSYPHLGPDDHRYRAAAGGGALLDAGVYPLSMAVRLLGTADVTVTANRFAGDHEVDVSGTATLTDARGRSFQCSWAMGSAYTNMARLVGTNGSIEVDRLFTKPETYVEPIILVGGWGERTPVAYRTANQFTAMLDDVARHHGDPHWVDSLHRSIEDRWSVIGRVIDAAG
jgi:predicted dehydrogenase